MSNTVKAIRPLNRFPQSPMSEEMSRLFLGLSLMPEEDAKNMWAEIVGKEFLVGLIDHRATLVHLNLTPQLKVFLAFLSKTPAIAMLYIHAIWHDKNGRERAGTNPYGIDHFAWLFPDGYPEKHVLEYAWHMQKDDKPGSMDGNNIDNMACFGAVYDESQWKEPAVFDKGPLGDVFRAQNGIAKILKDANDE